MAAQIDRVLGQPLRATPCALGLLPKQAVRPSRHCLRRQAVLMAFYLRHYRWSLAHTNPAIGWLSVALAVECQEGPEVCRLGPPRSQITLQARMYAIVDYRGCYIEP